MQKLMNTIQLPLEIPADIIGLPTRGATITDCTLFHAGGKDTGPLAMAFGFFFPADVYRYEGVIHPVDPEAPDIHFEAGMPVMWNGKIIQQGGGGVNGFVPPSSMPLHGQDREKNTALEQGYVVFGSDSGHAIINGNMMDCSWAMNQECFENFAYLSLKKTKDVVMYLTELVYGKKPERVYFYGGSNGGRECIKAIQNYPEDYDGAICFFPVLYWILKVLMDVRNGDTFELIGEEGRIDQETYDRILKVTMDICDELDGAKDNIISNWKAASEKRKEVEEEVQKIVTLEQFEMLRQFAAPMSLPFPLAFGEVSLPGYQAFEGTSLLSHFSSLNSTRDAAQLSGGDSLIANVFVQDPDFNPRQFDPVQWKDRIQEVSRWMDAYGADLDAYKKKGGKLILVQGASDPLVTAHGTIQFYERLVDRYGKEQLDKFMKFYLAPGYGHGTDGTFLITSDFIGALNEWVEEEKEPKDLVVYDRNPATTGRTRPLYEYPEYPFYDGKGDVNKADSFLRGK